MNCQLCLFSGYRFESESSTDLENHVKFHQDQVGDYGPAATQRYFQRCFPNLRLGHGSSYVDTASMAAADAGTSAAVGVISGIQRSKVKSAKKNTSEKNVGRPRTQPQTPLELYCARVLGSYNTKRVRCAYCHAEIGRDRSDPKLILNHACHHLKMNLFTCRYCDYEGMTPASIRSHLKGHQVPFRDCHVDDRTQENHEAITAMIDRCFPMDPALRDAAPVTKPTMIRHKSKLTNINRHCRHLIKENSRHGEIQCQRCRKMIQTTDGRLEFKSKFMVDHVFQHHLKVDLYRCNRCAFAAKLHEDMKSHLQKSHQLPDIGNYTDHIKKYEQYLMKVLTRCFGGNSNGTPIQESRNLMQYCLQLLKPNADQSQAQCSNCSEPITTTGDKSIDTRAAIDHFDTT